MGKKKKLQAHPATSPHSGLQVSSCEALPPEQVHPQSFTHFQSQPLFSSQFPSSHRPAFHPITHEHQGKADAGQEEFNCSGLTAHPPASPRQPDARQGSSANSDAGDGEAAALLAQLEELTRAREDDKTAWLAEKQRLQIEATSLREQLQERTKLFKDALVSLDAKGTELEKLRRQVRLIFVLKTGSRGRIRGRERINRTRTDMQQVSALGAFAGEERRSAWG